MNVPMFDYLAQFRALEPEFRSAIDRVLGSGLLILGPEVEAFEREMAAQLGPGQVVGVNSGTDALVLALTALGVGAGDEVITVANTAVPTVSAIRELGAVPVFCDIDPTTCLLDVGAVRTTAKTRAVVAVHLYGNCVDITALRAKVGDHIAIVEDCAQAHGASWRDRPAGTMGDAAAFSFYPTKNLGAYGDGGAVYCADPARAAVIRSLRMYGFEGQYYAEREGRNSRLDPIQAAILRVKLPHLGAAVARRRAIAAQYDRLLSPSVKRVVAAPDVAHGYHLYVVRVPERERLRTALRERGIQTGVHYPHPIHLMRGYAFLGYTPGSLPETERAADEVMSLPLYPELDDAAVEYVATTLNQLV